MNLCSSLLHILINQREKDTNATYIGSKQFSDSVLENETIVKSLDLSGMTSQRYRFGTGNRYSY
jgi:hypothetical protein